MSKALGKRWVGALCGVLAGALMSAPTTHAEVDTSGSILVYPKVMSNSVRDTIISLSNTSNNLVHARCFYVNAAPLNPNARPGPTNPRQWQVTDFEIWLTRQQPTHWVASQGRRVDPLDGFGNDGSGLDPGAIPPVPPGFEGELKCVQVTASGEPFGGNNLKGEAVLRRDDGDVSKYSAVAILANPDLAGAGNVNELRLDNAGLVNDGEFDSCPQTLLLNHFADGIPDPVIESLDPGQCEGGGDCAIRTALTLVPCTQDFENLIPTRVTVQFERYNEFEQLLSASTPILCWGNFFLAEVDSPNNPERSIFAPGLDSSPTMFTRITPADFDGGVIGIAEELHINDSRESGWAAWNLQSEGTRYEGTLNRPGGPVVDTIVIPES